MSCMDGADDGLCYGCGNPDGNGTCVRDDGWSDYEENQFRDDDEVALNTLAGLLKDSMSGCLDTERAELVLNMMSKRTPEEPRWSFNKRLEKFIAELDQCLTENDAYLYRAYHKGNGFRIIFEKENIDWIIEKMIKGDD